MSNPLFASDGLLAALRAAVTERLSNYDELQNPVTIRVLDGGKTDLISAVRDALTKRTSGMCLVVTVPRLEAGQDTPRHVAATISVQIYEHPLQNWSTQGARVAPEDIGERIMARLLFDDAPPGDGWTPPGGWSRLMFSGLRPVFASTEQTVFEITFTTETVIRRATS